MSPCDVIYREPRSRFIADFIGQMNWFAAEPAKAVGGGLRTYCLGHDLTLVAPEHTDGRRSGDLVIGVSPERTLVIGSTARSELRGAAYNQLGGLVEQMEHLGANMVVWVRLSNGGLVQALNRNLDRPPGEFSAPVVVASSARDCIVLPTEDESGRSQ